MVKVCCDYVVIGIKVIFFLMDKRLFRFVYVSGVNVVWDLVKKLLLLGDYCVFCGEVENKILEFGKIFGGRVEVVIVKLGIIFGLIKEMGVLVRVFFGVVGIGKVRVG